jgi:hypothetical protein
MLSYQGPRPRWPGTVQMAWNDKYWDIISNLYWTPRYLGLKSIARDKWEIEGDRVSIPKALIANTSGPLYSRSRSFGETRAYLNGQEEILNQMFNLVFSIAGDQVVSRLLCKPLGISDPGPFQSLGREIGLRYGWRKSENVTQQDGFFVTPSSLIAVELKLESTSWPEQITKYVALMIWEEAYSRPRANLGLLFIVPEAALSAHWANVGLDGPKIDARFADRLDRLRLPKKIQTLFEANSAEVHSVLTRLHLAAVSWNQLRTGIAAIETELNPQNVGDQTLLRLLAGFRDQLEHHDKTGVNVPVGGGELFTVEDGKITDRGLHGEMLGGGDHVDVTAIGREQARKTGLTEQELIGLFGPLGEKPSS